MKKYFLLVLFSFIATITLWANGGKMFYAEKFGAVADGTTLNTKALQSAIDKISSKDGGTLVLSKGVYLTGYLILKSGVTLHIEEGSVLLGSSSPYHYEKLVAEGAPVSPKQDDNSKLALLLAYKANNIGITGKGIIDGQGQRLALTVDSLHHTGERIDPNYNKWSNRPGETARPKIINFMMCNDVVVKDVTIKNASCWVTSYEICNRLLIDNVTVMSRAFWNNDGMDITDCRNVRVVNCNVDTADDGICLKSYYEGYYCDSIYIGNCTVRSSASAIKFGTASIGGFKNVEIENITVFDTFRSVIAIETVDGGFIENVKVNNVAALNTGNAFFMRIGHRAGKTPGTLKNVTIQNMFVEVPFGRPDEDYDMRGPALPFFHNQFPASICGIPGHLIENVKLENINISYPGRACKGFAYVPTWRLDAVPEKIKDYPEYSMFGELPSWGLYVRHAKGITMKNINFILKDQDFRPAFVFDDVDGLKMDDILVPERTKDHVILKDTKNVVVEKGIGVKTY
jgi:hypothetical protein